MSAPYNVRYFIRMVIAVIVLIVGCVVAVNKGYVRSVELGLLVGAIWARIDRVLALTTHKHLKLSSMNPRFSAIMGALAFGLLTLGNSLFNSTNSAQFFVFLGALLLPLLLYLCWTVWATAQKDPDYWKR